MHAYHHSNNDKDLAYKEKTEKERSGISATLLLQSFIEKHSYFTR